MKITWKNRLWLSCLTMMGLLAAPAARAQFSPDLIMENYNGATMALTSSMLNKKMLDDAIRRSRGKSSKTAAPVKAAAPKVNLTYTPTAALQQQTVQNLVSKMQAQNPEAAQAAGKALGSGQTSYYKLFDQMMADSGLPTNNAATALGAYLGLGYMVINNMQNGTTPAMDKALQKQAAGILAQNPKLTSPAAVAQLGEEMKLQVVVLYLGWQNALKSPDQLQPFQASIAQSFASMGLDLRLVTLTENGLVKK